MGANRPRGNRINVPHILCANGECPLELMPSRAVLAALLQNYTKPYTPKQHRSCRVIDSELWACCFLPHPSPQPSQVASPLRGTEENNTDHGTFCKCRQVTESQALVREGLVTQL